jgi:hypothetical protein
MADLALLLEDGRHVFAERHGGRLRNDANDASEGDDANKGNDANDCQNSNT